MRIHPSRFEQVTALTDALLAVLCIYGVWQLNGYFGFRADVWKWTFGLLCISSVLGAVAHGLQMLEKTNERIWMPLNLSLGMALGLFVVGALFDLGGESLARKVLPFMLGVGVVFFLVTILRPGTFLTFIAYEAVAMFFALGVYLFLATKGLLPGAGWMLAGVSVTIIAAVVQAMGKAGRSIVWHFDNNGVFHLIQMLGIVLLLAGLNASL